MQPASVKSSSPTISARSVSWLFGVASLLFIGVAIAYAFFIIFSQKTGNDEGYLMVTLQSFFEGNPLYDTVFTQYGPFYYIYEWLVHSVFFLPVTHDVTRVLCIMHWLIAALVLGITGGVMMRSALAGVFVFMQGIVHLTLIANEPGHPQELVVILLALGVLAAAKGINRMGVIMSLGLIGAALACTKINVGAFFCFAILAAIQIHAAGRFARGVWIWLPIGVSSLLPLILMRRHLTEAWCLNYALMAAATIVVTLIVAVRFSRRGSLGLKSCFQFTGFFLVFSAFFLGVAYLNGSTIYGLLDGLLLTPLKMPSIALFPKHVHDGSLLNTLTAVGVAIVALSCAHSEKVQTILVTAKGLFGLTGSLVLVGNADIQFDFLFPWIWLVMIPSQSDNNQETSEIFPRVFLCLAASWQSLQAYPIAGTQVVIATFLNPIIYTVCLYDAFRVAAQKVRFYEQISQLTPRSSIMLQAFGIGVLLSLFTFAWCKPFALQRNYASLTPLDLPGSSLIRLLPEATQSHQALSHYLETECDTFITYPGINSYYFWSNKKPPTHLNSTGWGLFNQNQQDEIRATLLNYERSKIVVHKNLLKSWEAGVPVQIKTLVNFVLQECREVTRIEPFVIFEPEAQEEESVRE